MRDRFFYTVAWHTVTGKYKYKTYKNFKPKRDELARLKTYVFSKAFYIEAVRIETFTSLTGMKTRLRNGFTWSERGLAKALLEILYELKGVRYNDPYIEGISKEHNI